MKSTSPGKSLVVFLWFAAALLGAGCSTTLRPPYPPAIDPSNTATKYKAEEFLVDSKDYREAVRTGDLTAATTIRDRIVFRTKSSIDGNFNEFKLRFFENRATFDTAADWVELALAGATTLTVGERSKTVLGAILTAAKGGRLSVDKNWFREKTSEALVASMQSERDRKWALISDKLTEGDADQYSFDEAWGDLLDYFYAGTLESALISIASKTGQAAEESKEKKVAAEENRADQFSLRAATPDEIATVEMLTDARDKLDAAGAEAVLKKLRIKLPPKADAKALLREQIDKLQPGDTRGRLKLARAMGIRGK